VLVNLLGNAVKFTEKGEVVLRVMAGADGSSPGVVRFEVKDTGVGIKPDQRERLFESFTQADASTTRTYGGTGLGLAICKELIERMGGEIGVVSTFGRGSTFWFSCPFERAKLVRAKSRDGRESLRGLAVLVVDDNKTNRVILEQSLKAWAMKPKAFERGAAALAELEAAATRGEPYKVAILDYHMPEMDGLELARAIRADASLRDLKLVLLTSSAKPGDSRIARDAGIDAFLTKPVKVSALYDCLATVVAAVPSVVRAPTVADTSLVEVAAEGGGHVLVVDDNPVNLRVAARMLEKMGHQVETAVNGVEAVAAVAHVEYDAVLMDCQMPEMDGFEATMEIRRNEATDRHLPIIAMTAGAMKGDEEKCIAAGMDAYIAKPVKLATLAAVLDPWIKSETPTSSMGATEGTEATLLDEALLGELRELGAAEFRKLLKFFLRDSAARVAKMHKLALKGDAHGIGELAHSLKGSSANFGARALADSCAELQTMVAAGDMVAVNRQIETIDREFKRAEAALRPRLAASQ
jgi:CheY-like chemotaxis protein